MTTFCFRRPRLTVAALVLFSGGAGLGWWITSCDPLILARMPSFAAAETVDGARASDPARRCEEVLRLPVDQRLAAATALLIAAAEEPGLASRLARRLCAADPIFRREHGDTLITMLGASHQFEAALAFAELGGPERSVWLQRCLEDWAETDPGAAMQAALAQPGGEGLAHVAAQWAERDPAAAAEFALQSLPGDARAQALAVVLPAWIQRQPAAAASWLDQLEPNQELDGSLATLARLPAIVATWPDVACDWSAAIVDPEIRQRTQTELVQQWAGTDRTAARAYLTSASRLLPPDRLRLLALLEGWRD